ncbi:MAG: cation transporter [Clostridia bacterium]|nr:cation transporter [Clostridia bacterium]
MVKTTVKIEGMGCPMCEAHVCETIRNAFPGAKKVSASHKSGEAQFVTDSEPDAAALKETINATGYTFISCSSVPEDKNVLSLFGKK